MVKKGVFITFEGIDGSGKSTQVKKFVEWLFLRDKHFHIVLTRNPYRDVNIRKILREDMDAFSKSDILASCFINDRKIMTKEIVIPNLEKGYFVISDRYKLSTVAYQGAQGLSMKDLLDMQSMLPVPDITFVVDIPAKVAAQRMHKDSKREVGKEHKFEADLKFLESTRQNYHKLKKMLSKEKIFIVNGNREPDEIFEDIKEIFEKEILNKDISKSIGLIR